MRNILPNLTETVITKGNQACTCSIVCSQCLGHVLCVYVDLLHTSSSLKSMTHQSRVVRLPGHRDWFRDGHVIQRDLISNHWDLDNTVRCVMQQVLMTTPPLTSSAHKGSYTQYTGMGPTVKGKSKPKPGYLKNERRGGFFTAHTVRNRAVYKHATQDAISSAKGWEVLNQGANGKTV